MRASWFSPRPWRICRYGGDFRARRLTCLDQYLTMAFAQSSCRESRRDIEARLTAHLAKLYQMGIRGPVARATLADANERHLYAGDAFAVELRHTVHALDSTATDLCLSLFPWAPFRRAKGAVKLHAVLDLRGNIPGTPTSRGNDAAAHQTRETLRRRPRGCRAWHRIARGSLRRWRRKHTRRAAPPRDRYREPSALRCGCRAAIRPRP